MDKLWSMQYHLICNVACTTSTPFSSRPVAVMLAYAISPHFVLGPTYAYHLILLFDLYSVLATRHISTNCNFSLIFFTCPSFNSFVRQSATISLASFSLVNFSMLYYFPHKIITKLYVLSPLEVLCRVSSSPLKSTGIVLHYHR